MVRNSLIGIDIHKQCNFGRLSSLLSMASHIYLCVNFYNQQNIYLLLISFNSFIRTFKTGLKPNVISISKAFPSSYSDQCGDRCGWLGPPW